MTASEPGQLYICPTPIGNLEDITDRVRRTLTEVDLIAAEDTRHTGRLLAAFDIDTPMISYHEHNENERAQQLVGQLLQGENIALVTDAGTPTISDPGFRIVAEAVAAGVRVVPLPGPVAAMVALAGSGLATDRFCFWGFMPRRKTEQKELIERLRYVDSTIIFYESPQRLQRTLQNLARAMPGRQVVVARELTKKFEEFHRGTARELAETFPRQKLKGEIVLLIDAPQEDETIEDADLKQLPLAEQYQVLVDSGLDPMEAVKTVARGHGVPKNAVYKIVRS